VVLDRVSGKIRDVLVVDHVAVSSSLEDLSLMHQGDGLSGCPALMQFVVYPRSLWASRAIATGGH
jgi:hypothetical protein